MSVSTREALVATLQGQADWRDSKAQEWPDDERNARSADALRRLAEWVQNLPGDDSHLTALGEIPGIDVSGFFSGGEEADRLVGTFGFHRDVQESDFGPFLEELYHAARSEYIRHAASATDPRDLIEWVEHEDPGASLEAIGAMLDWLEDVESDVVLKARIEGYSWARIGNALGRSKQAVWERYSDPDERSADES